MIIINDLHSNIMNLFLSATFPNLRYNENQITGIKLVVNIKQQLQMKKDDLIKESSETWTNQIANVKCSKSHSPTKTNVSGSLNATKIKYLLNPSSMPQSQPSPQQTPPVKSISNSEQPKSVAQIFSSQNANNTAQAKVIETAPSPKLPQPLTIISENSGN